jgi:hypothetical protein
VGAAGAGAQLLPPLPIPSAPGDLPVDESPGREHGARIAISPPAKPTLVRTIPIGRSPGEQPVVVASLPLKRVGPLRSGARLEAGGEMQVTVCLRRSIARERSGSGCAGRIYGYDPRIRAQLVLAPGKRVADPDRTVPVGDSRTLTCTQSQPDRNHHCAIALSWREVEFGLGGTRIPACAPRSCRLNLVASASDPAAGPRERVAVGGFESDGSVDNKGESRISAIRYPPDWDGVAETTSREPLLSGLPLARDNHDIDLESVYSVEVPSPRAGEQIRVAGRYLGALGGLPYNARTRTQLILADRPDAVQPGRRARRVAASSAFLAMESNFNCTQGPSGHRTPCAAGKVGVARIGESSDRSLFVNLLAGHGAIGFEARNHRAGDRVRVRRGGFLAVARLGLDPRDGVARPPHG